MVACWIKVREIFVDGLGDEGGCFVTSENNRGFHVGQQYRSFRKSQRLFYETKTEGGVSADLSSAGRNSSFRLPQAEHRNTGIGTYESFGAPVRIRDTFRKISASSKVTPLHASQQTLVVSLIVTDFWGWVGVPKGAAIVLINLFDDGNILCCNVNHCFSIVERNVVKRPNCNNINDFQDGSFSDILVAHFAMRIHDVHRDVCVEFDFHGHKITAR